MDLFVPGWLIGHFHKDQWSVDDKLAGGVAFKPPAPNHPDLAALWLLNVFSLLNVFLCYIYDPGFRFAALTASLLASNPSTWIPIVFIIFYLFLNERPVLLCVIQKPINRRKMSKWKIFFAWEWWNHGWCFCFVSFFFFI